MFQAESDSSQALETVAAGSAVREPGSPESGSGVVPSFLWQLKGYHKNLRRKQFEALVLAILPKPGKHRKTLLPHEWTALGTCVDPIEVNGYL